MSLKKIEEAREKLEDVKSWQTLLIEYDHKKRPNNYTCRQFNFAETKERLQIISDSFDVFMYNIDKAGATVKEYTGVNSKNTIEKITDVNTNTLTKDSWEKFKASIPSSDDTAHIDNNKCSAYAFIATYVDSEGQQKNIYFITKKNPIVNLKKKHIFSFKSNIVKKTSEPLLQFNKTFDVLIYENNLYSLNLNFEDIFNLERTHKKMTNAGLLKIKGKSVITDYQKFEEYALKGHTPRKFVTFSEDNLKLLEDIEARKAIADKLKLTLDDDNKFILDDDLKRSSFIKFVCDKLSRHIYWEIVIGLQKAVEQDS